MSKKIRWDLTPEQAALLTDLIVTCVETTIDSVEFGDEEVVKDSEDMLNTLWHIVQSNEIDLPRTELLDEFANSGGNIKL